MDDDRVEEEPGYGIGAVARRLGVPAPTLRTWNLRYGLGPSHRTSGGHRRYGARDLRMLQEMKRLIHEGVAAAEAAALARRLPAAAEVTPAPEPREPVGGHIMTVAALARAATALDGATVSQAIGAALARHGVRWTWLELVLPVFAAISRRQAETGAGIEVEHLFSDRLLAALLPLTDRPEHPVNPRPVLLACAPDEQHNLPAYALAAELTQTYRVQTRTLGARTPYPALGDAMRRLGPSVVFLWAQLRETGDPAPLARLPALRPPVPVVAGGPGWGPGLPGKVTRVTAFDQAITTVLARLPGG